MSTHIYLEGNLGQHECRICGETYDDGHHLRPMPEPFISLSSDEGLRKRWRELVGELMEIERAQGLHPKVLPKILSRR